MVNFSSNFSKEMEKKFEGKKFLKIWFRGSQAHKLIDSILTTHQLTAPSLHISVIEKDSSKMRHLIQMKMYKGKICRSCKYY